MGVCVYVGVYVSRRAHMCVFLPTALIGRVWPINESTYRVQTLIHNTNMTDTHIIIFSYLSRWGDAPEGGLPASLSTALDAVDPSRELMFKYYDSVEDADMERKLHVFRKVFSRTLFGRGTL